MIFLLIFFVVGFGRYVSYLLIFSELSKRKREFRRDIFGWFAFTQKDQNQNSSLFFTLLWRFWLYIYRIESFSFIFCYFRNRVDLV